MKTFLKLIYAISLIIIINACSTTETSNKAGISPEEFSDRIQGKDVSLVVLKNANGLEMTVCNYGAKAISLMVPDKDGKFEDIVLGFDRLEDYLMPNSPYFGSVIGRYANRIGDAKFSLNDQEYQLTKNNNTDHIHGGDYGFDKKVWDMTKIDNQTVEFHLLSRDMEEGYPGDLDITMIYTLTNDNEFKISYNAHTNKTTVVNLTHHSYFNLLGAGNGTISDHILYINADYYTPTDARLIPTGDISPVAATPLDFTKPTKIGARINEEFEALNFGNGYDLNYVLNQPEPKMLVLAASVYEPTSGRTMEVYTDEPGIHFYSNNYMNGSTIGKHEKSYMRYSGFCLETQHFPDSPNKPNFPSTVLNPGEKYTQTCIYKFGIKQSFK